MSSKVEMETQGYLLMFFLKKVIWTLFTIIIGYLMISSIFSTCYIGPLAYFVNSGGTETNSLHTFFIRDNYIIHILLFALFSVILAKYVGKENNKFPPFLMKGVALAVLGSLLLYVIYVSQYYPKSDQRHIVEAAMAFNEGDFSELKKGGYLFEYPFQFGITVFYWILIKIFGNLNIVAFQVINGFFMLLSYYLLAKTGALLKEGKDKSETATLTVCILFLPYLLYVTFLYGTVVGFCMVSLSFYHMLLFEKKSKWGYLLSSSICMAVATILKTNYSIALIAMIIYLAGKIVADFNVDRKNTYKSMIYGIVMLLFFFVGKWGINGYLTYLNDGEQIQGIPMISWVTMGLQDSKTAPGWYNGYNNTIYRQNGCNYDETEKIAKDDLKKIIKKYPEDITASISLFVKKTASQWNNPTFQSLWILEARSGKNGLAWLLQEKGRYIYIWFVNILQTWILIGTFLYAVFRFKKSTWQEIVYPLFFIGGLMFHMFWEAQSMYAVTYFILLLPLCVLGYAEWREFLLQKKLTGKRVMVMAGIIILICAASYTDFFCKMFARKDDTGVFDTYTQEMVLQE